MIDDLEGYFFLLSRLVSIFYSLVLSVCLTRSSCTVPWESIHPLGILSVFLPYNLEFIWSVHNYSFQFLKALQFNVSCGCFDCHQFWQFWGEKQILELKLSNTRNDSNISGNPSKNYYFKNWWATVVYIWNTCSSQVYSLTLWRLCFVVNNTTSVCLYCSWVDLGGTDKDNRIS